MLRKQSHKILERPEISAILDSVVSGIMTVNLDFVITHFNKSAEQITGFSADEAVGQYCYNILRSPVCASGCMLNDAMQTGHNFVGLEQTILNRHNHEIPVIVTSAAMHNNSGEIIGGVETFRDLSAVHTLRREMHRRYSLHDMVSKNHRMQEIFALIRDVAHSAATVLILGETGTGKELLAQAIHEESTRRAGPFIKVNCGALPDTLLETELFGHVAGAFTDAKKARKGRFELARGGTIFLDEIGDTSPAMQVKLLRVLQEGKYEPIGSSRTRTTDARVLAATNRDIKARVAQGDFREDLYYRINTVVMHVPPLRERREDLPLLIEHFLMRFNALTDKQVDHISQEAMRAFMAYSWPGNIRELEHAIEHAFILVRDHTIELTHLPEELLELKSINPVHPLKDPGQDLAQEERRLIQKALERHHWNKVEASKELGISRTTLWRKIRDYHIQRD
ncbi:MAG: Anaerobic nitric oxide reductase transcription regulator NorR [Phycisphaerae bacterium]|nr:Anaerobic nitric oxide reductase transcription regulator NorR [Phycisphaerae bacterium]